MSFQQRPIDPPHITAAIARAKAIRDPQLTQADALQLLDTMLRDGGCIDLVTASISYDDSWQEQDWRGNHATGEGREVMVLTPSFVVTRSINGKFVKSAHCSLVDAVRGLEK